MYLHLQNFSPHQVPICPVTATENDVEMVLWETAFKAAAWESRETQQYARDCGFLDFRWAKLPPHGQSKVIPLPLYVYTQSVGPFP